MKFFLITGGGDIVQLGAKEEPNRKPLSHKSIKENMA